MPGLSPFASPKTWPIDSNPSSPTAAACLRRLIPRFPTACAINGEKLDVRWERRRSWTDLGWKWSAGAHEHEKRIGHRPRSWGRLPDFRIFAANYLVGSSSENRTHHRRITGPGISNGEGIRFSWSKRFRGHPMLSTKMLCEFAR